MKEFGKERNTFMVRPSLNFHLSEIFDISLFACPIIRMNAYNLKKKICYSGEYEFEVSIGSWIVGHNFEKTLFNENKKIEEICYRNNIPLL